MPAHHGVVRWPVPGFSRAFLSYFSVTSQLFCRNFSHISHFSVISQLFLVYFAVISHFSIISHLFLKHFAVISHFSVRLPTISHFSVTLPNYFPVTSRFSVRLPNLFSVTSRIFPFEFVTRKAPIYFMYGVTVGYISRNGTERKRNASTGSECLHSYISKTIRY